MFNAHPLVNRSLVRWSLATSVACITFASVPSPTLALSGFTGDFDPGNWSLNNSNADGFVDTTNAASGAINLFGGDNSSFSSGNTDWTTTATNTFAVSFDWNYSSLDIDGQDTAGYLLNSVYNVLASADGEFSTSPVSFTVNPGDTFGFRVFTVDNSGGSGVLSVSNFNAEPVPFEFSPILGLSIFGLNGLYRVWRKQKLNNLN
ncbi:hypothetical protein WJM97_17045 [Okeanomitos corallinicola TIOX110]|uniref:PEP-CTERM sorting domain-containing protein n=1 Tax=Okeanomitos corallinicola TIOX110 TaxID=3133117 RepID=A0ABZ2UQ34_9CYAN